MISINCFQIVPSDVLKWVKWKRSFTYRLGFWLLGSYQLFVNSLFPVFIPLSLYLSGWFTSISHFDIYFAGTGHLSCGGNYSSLMWLCLWIFCGSRIHESQLLGFIKEVIISRCRKSPQIVRFWKSFIYTNKSSWRGTLKWGWYVELPTVL